LRLPPLVAAVDRALVAVGMPAPEETILVGLSGGADSVALLDALIQLRRRRRFIVEAAHLDHRLRPDSADDVAFCREVCRRLDVPLHAGEADVHARARRERGGLEQAARKERYAYLKDVATDRGAARIAVAHTRDDQAETLLLHLIRGAGRTGLGAMRARVGLLIRPLLGVSRDAVVAHLTERGLPWREDATNADLTLLRNRVRHELLPYLEARFNPSLRQGLARTASLLADEAALLLLEAGRLLDRISCREGEVLVVDRRALADAPLALGRLAVREALVRTGGLGRVGAVHVERILALARKANASGRTIGLPGGREVRYRQGELRLGPCPPAGGTARAPGREP